MFGGGIFGTTGFGFLRQGIAASTFTKTCSFSYKVTNLFNKTVDFSYESYGAFTLTKNLLYKTYRDMTVSSVFRYGTLNQITKSFLATYGTFNEVSTLFEFVWDTNARLFPYIYNNKTRDNAVKDLKVVPVESVTTTDSEIVQTTKSEEVLVGVNDKIVRKRRNRVKL